ncbi:hypothetical protein [Actinosynnema sp. NPDC020468]|uniref:hypothetical protein n=1 Tax=Actinosynnema sp. NPDC020468 TaxID=3154488 RepID=UPI0034104286
MGELWLARREPLSSPAVEARRGLVDGEARTYAVVWRTERGPVVYLSAVRTDHPDLVAQTAVRLVEPTDRRRAAVVVQCHQALEDGDVPTAHLYRLVADRAEWVTGMEFDEFAPALGVSFPVWVDGALTEESARLAGEETVTAPDTCTGWPDVQRRLEAALDCGLPERFPAAWAALATDAAVRLEHLRDVHAGLVEVGDGWHLAVRPARPAPPPLLEQRISVAYPVDDPRRARAELAELRRLEADLDVDAPEGCAFEACCALLTTQPQAADDAVVLYYGGWHGPAVEVWRHSMTELTDEESAAAGRLRRVRRLRGEQDPDALGPLYRDREGRYVQVVTHGAAVDAWAEWPVSLDVVAGWTDTTVLAADRNEGNAFLLALTPGPGGLKVDPVPLAPRSGRDGHGYGYDGGTPFATYKALLRCALRDGAAVDRVARAVVSRGSGSQLWEALTTTRGPLRLSWPRLRLWARADLRRG